MLSVPFIIPSSKTENVSVDQKVSSSSYYIDIFEKYNNTNNDYNNYTNQHEIPSFILLGPPKVCIYFNG